MVEQAPKEVALTFSEQIAVDEDAIRVLDPAGNRVDTEETPGRSARAARSTR